MKARSATIAPSEAGYTTATDSLRQIFSTLQLRGLRVGSIYEWLGRNAGVPVDGGCVDMSKATTIKRARREAR